MKIFLLIVFICQIVLANAQNRAEINRLTYTIFASDISTAKTKFDLYLKKQPSCLVESK